MPRPFAISSQAFMRWLSIALMLLFASPASAQLADGQRFLERADFTRAVRRPDGASCADDPGPYYARRGEDRSRCAGRCSLDRVCESRPGEGARCVAYVLCARDLACLGTGVSEGTCMPATCEP